MLSELLGSRPLLMASGAPSRFFKAVSFTAGVLRRSREPESGVAGPTAIAPNLGLKRSPSCVSTNRPFTLELNRCATAVAHTAVADALPHEKRVKEVHMKFGRRMYSSIYACASGVLLTGAVASAQTRLAAAAPPHRSLLSDLVTYELVDLYVPRKPSSILNGT
jgi:hypothetical protein